MRKGYANTKLQTQDQGESLLIQNCMYMVQWMRLSKRSLLVKYNMWNIGMMNVYIPVYYIALGVTHVGSGAKYNDIMETIIITSMK